MRIPNTLLISAIAVLDDVRKCVTMDFKSAGSRVCLISQGISNLSYLAQTHRDLATFIAMGNATAVHDISDGGIAVAAAEMCIASGIGFMASGERFSIDGVFSERPGQYLVELANAATAESLRDAMKGSADVTAIGTTTKVPIFTIQSAQQGGMEIGLDELTTAWRETLDW